MATLAEVLITVSSLRFTILVTPKNAPRTVFTKLNFLRNLRIDPTSVTLLGCDTLAYCSEP
jgi:hypothetical protein